MSCFDDSKGEPDHAKGGCTDLICLSIFLIFIGVMVIVSSFAFVYGNPYLLSNGYDSFGNICGRKNEVIPSMKYTGIDMSNRKYVFFFNVWDPFNSVKLCVEKCPHQKLINFEQLKTFTEKTSSSLCYDLSLKQYESGIFILNEEWQFVCPNFPVYESTSVFNRCISKATKDVSMKIIYRIHSYLNNVEFLQQLFTDFYNSWVTMVWLIALAVVISLIIIMSFHYYAFIISWTVLITTSLAAIVLTTALWITLVNIEDELDNMPKVELLEKMVRNEIAFLVFAILATIITIILITIAFFMRKKIQLMVDSFKLASKCLKDIPCLLSQPLWTCIALMLFIIFWIAVMLSLATANRSSLMKTEHHNYSQQTANMNITLNELPVSFPSFQFEDPTWIQSMWWLYIIAFIWLCEFILAFQQMVIAGAVSMWYFKRSEDQLSWVIMKSFRNVFCFHIGSIALGSFLITIFKIPRLILTFINKRLEKQTPEWCQGCVKCCGVCCWCCLNAFERFIKYMNHNAYTIVVCRRINFCCSAKRAFDILSSHVLVIAVIDKAGDCILFFGQCFVTILIGIIALFTMQNDPELYFFAGPLLVVCVSTYFIAHCFFSIYEMLIDTLFLCMCEDYHFRSHQALFADGSFENFMKERHIKPATLRNSEEI